MFGDFYGIVEDMMYALERRMQAIEVEMKDKEDTEDLEKEYGLCDEAYYLASNLLDTLEQGKGLY